MACCQASAGCMVACALTAGNTKGPSHVAVPHGANAWTGTGTRVQCAGGGGVS